MCRVQSPRLATVEALSQVMRVPEVEIPDLRALDAYSDDVGRAFRLMSATDSDLISAGRSD
jgi:hypothetical protein